MAVTLDNMLAYGVGLCGSILLKALLPHIRIALQYTCPLVLEIVKIAPLPRITNLLCIWGRKHLVYRQTVRQHSFVNSWSRIDALLLITYFAANLTCIFVDLPGAEKASNRAGTLALINMLLLYAGPCFSFIADILNVSLREYRRIHTCAGCAVFGLSTFHAAVTIINKRGFSLRETHYLWPFIAILSIWLLMLPLWALSKFLPYEFLLFSHHAASFVVFYFTWRHLSSKELFPRLYLYVILGVFFSSFLLQTGINIYRGGLRCSWARLSYVGGTQVSEIEPSRRKSEPGMIRVTLHLRKPLKVELGQYINLWAFSSPLSLIQRHPFTVISWSHSPQKQLELLIEPRQGLTKNFLNLVSYGDTTSIAAFTGPHGRGAPVDKFENVLLAATGSGIIALLPYFAKLTREQHAYKCCTRRLHLVWQIDDLVVVPAALDFINLALGDNKLDEICTHCAKEHQSLRLTFCVEIRKTATTYEYLLAVSESPMRTQKSKLQQKDHVSLSTGNERGQGHQILSDSSKVTQASDGKTTGTVKIESSSSILGTRVRLCSPPISWHDILKDDVKYKPDEKQLLVIASVSRFVKDSLTDTVREYARDISLVYTEYQP